MAISPNIEDRELKKFRECPSDSGEVVIAVQLCQDPSDPPLRVDPEGGRGDNSISFNEVNAVPTNVETLIHSFIVPVGKGLDFKGCFVSGENVAKFTVKKNNETIGVKRTWWTNFNADFSFGEETLNAGERVEIFVENNGDDPVSFESTILGNIYDQS